MLHACVAAPLHVAPEPTGAGFVHERVWVPPPQVAEHADHADHPPFVAVGHVVGALQICDAAPMQAAPPLLGDGFVHVRVCTPLPHAAEHADQVDQPPLIAHGVIHVAPIMFFVMSFTPLIMGLGCAVVMA